MEKVFTRRLLAIRLLCLFVFLLSLCAYLPAQKKQMQNNPMSKRPTTTAGRRNMTDAAGRVHKRGENRISDAQRKAAAHHRQAMAGERNHGSKKRGVK
jgi:hypothetical protein